MPLRIAKILVVAMLALQASLVAFGNLTDYGTNFAFVQHVMQMDTIFPTSAIHYRAVTSPVLHHTAYALIIAMECLVALLCALGAWRMWQRHRDPSALFERAKGLAVVGLSLGILLWLGGFIAVGGEWFGIETAFRLVAMLLLALIFLGQRDAELD